MKGLAAILMFGAAMAASGEAAEYTAPDRSFSIRVPEGWRARVAQMSGQPVTVLEPAGGGEERIIVGAGVAAAHSIQELSQQAAQMAGGYMQGARMSASPAFATQDGSPIAEQEYQTFQLAAWNGMMLKGEFYFAVMAMVRPQQIDMARKRGKEILSSVRFQGLQRNPQLERALVGRWENSVNTSNRTGVRDKSWYTSNWTVTFTPDGRFRSVKQNYFDTTNETYGGGSVGASDTHTGTYRVMGGMLIAEVDGVGRVLYTVEFYPSGNGVKLNGNLFTR